MITVQKPDLTHYFNQMPYIGKYLRFDYESANTLTEMVDLFHKWKTEQAQSNNPVRKIHFEAASNFIYTLITSKSYASKTFETI